MSAKKAYIPAAGHDLFLPFYDLSARLMGAGRLWRELLHQAAPLRGQRVLEIGCGTGSLTILAAQLYPGIEIAALDPDPKALARAGRKARRVETPVGFTRAFSQRLPFAGQTFDHVFSSFMFHHLDNETKAATLREVRRVLKPGGSFHLIDFAVSQSRLSRWLLSHHVDSDNTEAHLLALMAQAGLANAGVTGRRAVFFGLAEAVRYRASAAVT